MTKEEAIKWLDNLIQDIGQMRHQDLWDYAQALSEIGQMIDEMPNIVRCKDCKYHHTVLCAMTDGYQDWANNYDYCSCGVHTENGGKVNEI